MTLTFRPPMAEIRAGARHDLAAAMPSRESRWAYEDHKADVLHEIAMHPYDWFPQSDVDKASILGSKPEPGSHLSPWFARPWGILGSQAHWGPGKSRFRVHQAPRYSRAPDLGSPAMLVHCELRGVQHRR